MKSDKLELLSQESIHVCAPLGFVFHGEPINNYNMQPYE